MPHPDDDTPRPYHAPRRSAQAAATRQAILDAAQELFLAHGYAATSVRAVAAAAEVSDQTVYNVFGDKASLLVAVGERIVSGELDPPPGGGRDLEAELEAAPDQAARLRVVAAWSRRAWEHGMLQFESMLLDAAASDPRVAEVAAAAWDHKYRDNQRLFPAAFPADSRHDDFDTDDALDILFAIDSAAFVRILIEDRGWSYDKYQDRIAIILRRLFTTLDE